MGEFSSMSDLVSQSLSEFISRYECKKDEEMNHQSSTELLLKVLLQTEEGQKVLASLSKTESEKKKGNIELPPRRVIFD